MRERWNQLGEVNTPGSGEREGMSPVCFTPRASGFAWSQLTTAGDCQPAGRDVDDAARGGGMAHRRRVRLQPRKHRSLPTRPRHIEVVAQVTGARAEEVDDRSQSRWRSPVRERGLETHPQQYAVRPSPTVRNQFTYERDYRPPRRDVLKPDGTRSKTQKNKPAGRRESGKSRPRRRSARVLRTRSATDATRANGSAHPPHLHARRLEGRAGLHDRPRELSVPRDGRRHRIGGVNTR